MTSYYIEMTFDLGSPIDRHLEEHLDEVAEALAQLGDVQGDIGADLASGKVDLCMTLDADDRPSALLQAFTAARTAVHAAGGETGTWDGWLPKLLDDDQYTSTVTLSSLIAG